MEYFVKKQVSKRLRLVPIVFSRLVIDSQQLKAIELKLSCNTFSEILT